MGRHTMPRCTTLQCAHAAAAGWVRGRDSISMAQHTQIVLNQAPCLTTNLDKVTSAPLASCACRGARHVSPRHSALSRADKQKNAVYKLMLCGAMRAEHDAMANVAGTFSTSELLADCRADSRAGDLSCGDKCTQCTQCTIYTMPSIAGEGALGASRCNMVQVESSWSRARQERACC